MTLNLISTEQCINKLQNYATRKVFSWNPFNLFNRKLRNHNTANDIAKLLNQATLSDTDLLKIASSIHRFEDSKLQHDLLCFLHTKINDSQKSFVTKRENVNQINQILQDLLKKRYSPWWTLFLIEIPYYSYSFRNNLRSLLGNINYLFTTRRTETKQQLINAYSNEEIINQIISTYDTSAKKIESEKELTKVLEITLDQTIDHTQRQLLKEILKITKTLPFGQLLISTAVLSSVISSYLSQKANKNKSIQEQAQDILYIISKILLKTNATEIVKSFIPGVSEVVEAVISVGGSKSAPNPLHTDQKIGKAIASAAGGTLGGAIGSVVPFIGTYIGAYVGAVVSKTAATRFYQVLETWQKAPRGSESIIPRYSRSYFSLIDNDAKNILEPLYKNYVETEKKSKMLGDQLAKWLCIYTLVQSSKEKASEEYLEIINEEIKKIQQEFSDLKYNHSKISMYLYSKKPNNFARIVEYRTKIKECLKPLHTPILSMLNEYFSPTLKTASTSTSTADSYGANEKDLSMGDALDKPGRPLKFFEDKITDSRGTVNPGQVEESECTDYPDLSTVFGNT